jgi:hypothetical protein
MAMSNHTDHPGTSTTATAPRSGGGATGVLLDRERRLRLGWRLLTYLIVWATVVGIVGTVAVGGQPTPARQAAGLVAVPATLAVTLVFRRFVDRRTWRAVGLPWPSRRDLLAAIAGFAAGMAVIAVLFAIEWSAGWVRVTGTSLAAQGIAGAAAMLAGGLALQLAAGFTEELAFRGYVFCNLAERSSLRRAAIITGLLFAAGHLADVSSPVFGLHVLVGAVAISSLWVLTRLSTATLWTAIGMHAAWNWAEQSLFGLAPGMAPSSGALLQVDQTGPALLVGDVYPETGLLFTVAEVLLLLGYWLAVRRRCMTGGLERDGTEMRMRCS